MWVRHATYDERRNDEEEKKCIVHNNLRGHKKHFKDMCVQITQSI